MRLILKIFLILTILFLSREVQAHQRELSSTILVEQSENKWVLQVRAALTSFQYIIEQNYGPDAYDSPEEFQKMVIDLLEKNISIVFNENNLIELQNGKVKIGHESSVTFEILGTPKNIHSLEVINTEIRFLNIKKNLCVL